MTGGLIAFDIATTTGWAYGRVPVLATTALERAAQKPPQPASGVIRVQSAQGLGHFLSEFEERLCGLLDRYQPAGAIIEAPILPKACNFDTSCKLMSLAGEALKQFSRRGIRVLKQAQPATVKKHFTGNGRAEKADIMAECDRRGWTYATNDEADALAIWDLGCHLYRQGARQK